MMLDGGRPPDAHFLRGADDIGPVVYDAVIEVAVTAERPAGLAIVLILGRKHGIELENDLGPSHGECFLFCRAARAGVCSPQQR